MHLYLPQWIRVDRNRMLVLYLTLGIVHGHMMAQQTYIVSYDYHTQEIDWGPSLGRLSVDDVVQFKVLNYPKAGADSMRISYQFTTTDYGDAKSTLSVFSDQFSPPKAEEEDQPITTDKRQNAVVVTQLETSIEHIKSIMQSSSDRGHRSLEEYEFLSNLITSKITDTCSIYQLTHELADSLLKYVNLYHQQQLNTKDLSGQLGRLSELLIEIEKEEERRAGLYILEFEPGKQYGLRAIADSLLAHGITFSSLETSILEDRSIWAATSTIYTMPIMIKDSDWVDIQLYRANKNSNHIRKVEDRSFKYAVKGGFRLNWSAGISVSWLVDDQYQLSSTSIQDTTYYQENFITTDSIIGITSIGKKRIDAIDESRFNLGIVALLHAYWSGWPVKKVDLSLTTGFRVSQSSAPSLLGGGSIIFGKEKSRFTISGGIEVGKVDRLDPNYSAGDLVSDDTTDPPTISRWDHGWFIALSYNF